MGVLQRFFGRTYQDAALVRNLPAHGGTASTIRAARASDVSQIWSMHERISPASLYLRYLAAHKPSLQEIQRIVSRAPQRHVALVASVPESESPGRESPGRARLVGLAHYCVDPHNKAAFALLVEDAFQGCGVGRALFVALCTQARSAGLTALCASVHVTNKGMMRLIRSSGCRVQEQMWGDVCEVQMQLHTSPQDWLAVGQKTHFGIAL